MLFQYAAVESTKRYYQHLEETGGGLVKNGIVRIEKDDEFFVLYLKSKLAISDDIFIRIQNKNYSREQILPVDYDDMRRILRVRPKAAFTNILTAVPSQDIYIVSDMKFLVMRVKEWYEIYGSLPRIPTIRPIVSKHDFPNLQHQPSHDQNAAIEGVLSNSFTYVWGAPGTGKTRFVLARCILAYILEGKKILITAPTNNAVEQMLYGVLAVLQEAGVSVERVLRLGLASTEFVSRYPAVCENVAHAKQISAIQEQIKADHRQLEETNRLISMFANKALYREKITSYQECTTSLLPLFDELEALRFQKAELEAAAVVLKADRILLENQLKQRNAEHKKAVDSIRQLTPIVEKYSCGLRKLFWSKKHTQSLAELQKVMADKKRLQKEIDDLLQHLEAHKQQEREQRDSIKIQQLAVSQHQEKISTLTEFWSELHIIALRAMGRKDMSADYPNMVELLKSVSEKIHHIEQTLGVLESTSEQELLDHKQHLVLELESHKEQLSRAEAQSTSARFKNCSVLAATIDRCIKDLPPNGDFTPDHVFLDEAGYCSLIKAVTLMAYGCPLTFLGDHMQLPPICEINDHEMTGNNASIALWAQSALYAEDALTRDPEQIYADYMNHSAAHFCKLKKFNLIHTYRFGESLAQVLASDVYTEGFFGAPNHDTEIFYIPIHRVTDEKKRISTEECRAIVEYCRNTREQSIGIITPYTAQRDSLRKALSFDISLEDVVMTVHGSQGREWDVVLFSIVDTSDKWFTNSHNAKSNGKQVINTAVSRAKKKLILVCDADYWLTQRQQLIGKLLAVATKL